MQRPTPSKSLHTIHNHLKPKTMNECIAFFVYARYRARFPAQRSSTVDIVSPPPPTGQYQYSTVYQDRPLSYYSPSSWHLKLYNLRRRETHLNKPRTYTRTTVIRVRKDTDDVGEMFEIRIQEVTGSNNGRVIGYSSYSLSWFSSITPSEWQ
jgi:hypothetical protein